MIFLVTIRMQDGENRYYDYLTQIANTKKTAKDEIQKQIDEFNKEDFREQQICNIVELSESDYKILQKYGIV